MSVACSACTCFSNHSTKVDGRSIKFYSFPNDKKLKERWETVCSSICTSVTNKNLFRLCELHFEKNNFTEQMQLKSNAIPTIFDHPIKRKAGYVFQSSNIPVDPPAKRYKSENEDENISIPKGEIFFTSSPLKVKVRPQKSLRIETQTLNDPLSSVIKSTTGPSHYRLIIQIDKIRARPGPKSRKLLRSIQLKNKLKNSKNIQQSLNESSQRSCNELVESNLTVSDKSKLIESYQHRLNDIEEPNPKRSTQNSLKKSDQNNTTTSVQNLFQQLINSSEKFPRCESGCQLDNVIWNTEPAFKCRKCNNIYIPQPIKESNLYESNECESNNVYNQCMTCKQTFQTSGMLYSHIKEHLTCDICYCLFKTQFEHRNHMKLHTSINPSTPFQCHFCDLEFNTKISVRNHVSVVHMMKPKQINEQVSQQIPLGVHQCKICNLIFKNEENLRNHMDSHKVKDNSILPVGQLRSVKFSCSVCSMEFSTLAEIDFHTRIHIETNIEDLRCNICRKVFTSDRILSDHLREHVANAHRCHLCPKAFISVNSLQAHLQNHVSTFA